MTLISLTLSLFTLLGTAAADSNPRPTDASVKAPPLAPASGEPQAGATANERENNSAVETPIDYNADTPPPSSWQRDGQQAPASDSPLGDFEGRSLIAQLARTLLALFFVVGLIYLFAKLLLPRLLGLRTPLKGKDGKRLTLLERLPLDTKHAVYLVELSGGQQLVLGSGEHGLSMLFSLNAKDRPLSASVSPAKNFAQALDAQENPQDFRQIHKDGELS